ncbi:MAG: HAD hydrolase-like protein, partial [Alicyclobacillus sp.]|nr:HAD hydrolase-like protein [Alicyclobacillus sp.]
LEQRLQAVVGTRVPAFGENRSLWQVGQETFQEWYLGDEYVPVTRQPGKRGFLKDELPIVDPAAFSAFLQRLVKRGVRMGIATGRPEIETRVPLSELGWLQWFERQRITTASDVLAAETQLPARAPLAKPHPFSYLRSYLGTADAAVVLAQPLPLAPAEAEGVLIVGDSVADRLAAQSMGCRFAAVLTGLEGEAARSQFERLNADYVFSHVLELQQLFV